MTLQKLYLIRMLTLILFVLTSTRPSSCTEYSTVLLTTVILCIGGMHGAEGKTDTPFKTIHMELLSTHYTYQNVTDSVAPRGGATHSSSTSNLSVLLTCVTVFCVSKFKLNIFIQLKNAV